MDAADRVAESLLLRTVLHRETIRHSHATRDIAYTLAMHYGFGAKEASAIARAALLHDIGKCEVPREILDAPRPLTNPESAAMRAHPRIGAKIALEAGIEPAICEWIALHHERADGSGYDGVSGDLIPVPARLVIVADVWEASGALRPYNSYRSRDERWAILDKLGFPEQVDALRDLLEHPIARVS